jgi:hypothetical protein
MALINCLNLCQVFLNDVLSFQSPFMSPEPRALNAFRRVIAQSNCHIIMKVASVAIQTVNSSVS